MSWLFFVAPPSLLHRCCIDAATATKSGAKAATFATTNVCTPLHLVPLHLVAPPHTTLHPPLPLLPQPFVIRAATPADIDVLVRLEEESWDARLRVSRDRILQSITAFPDGAFVLELNSTDGGEGGVVVAVIYTQLIEGAHAIARVASVAEAASIAIQPPAALDLRRPIVHNAETSHGGGDGTPSDSDGPALQLLRVNTLLKSGGAVAGIAAGALLRDFGLRYAQVNIRTTRFRHAVLELAAVNDVERRHHYRDAMRPNTAILFPNHSLRRPWA